MVLRIQSPTYKKDEEKNFDAAKKEVLTMLKALYPEGDLSIGANGQFEMGKNAMAPNKSKMPTSAQCVFDLINSKNTWTIIPSVADPNTLLMWDFPATLPSNNDGFEKNGVAGKGTGGSIYIPISTSKHEYGAFDSQGKVQIASNLIVFAHELCGHAWYLDQGKHDAREQKRDNRPGHDQAINMENKIRLELSGRKELPADQLRGLFADPSKGESVWRKKGAKQWETRAPDQLQKDFD